MATPISVNTESALSEAEIAFLVLDETPAIVAYIDRNQVYRFANKAYLDWFGRTREEMMQLTMKEVIGPIYEMNLPYTLGALRGELQVFERQVVIPDGSIRHSLMTYKPHVHNGVVEGFFVHVADVTPLKKIESELRIEKEKVGEVAARELFNLQQTNAVLKRLGAIGQEITAHLTIPEITKSLNTHVCGVLDADALSIYFFDEDQSILKPVFYTELGNAGTMPTFSLTDHQHPLTRSVTERREIIVNMISADVETAFHFKAKILSLMIAPLVVADQVLGVMLIGSLKQDAYAEREKLIFRALCAYGTTAFVNAKAYHQLQDAQNQLVAQEKMVALGSLVAGIAHELNTPIGNSLLAATTLEMAATEFKTLMNSTSMRRSDLTTFVDVVEQTTDMVVHGLHSAANLVSSFKQVATDQSLEERESFLLHSLVSEVVGGMLQEVRAAEHVVSIEVPKDMLMDSFPGPLERVLRHLMSNALKHAFDDRHGGHIVIRALQTSSGRLNILFCDDGLGIHESNLKRIFDPFFTTKMGQGGGGLGLNISYNIVTSILEGSIDVHSEAGKGSTFILDLPFSIPVAK